MTILKKAGRTNYMRLRNELKSNEIMEFQRTGRYDWMYMKTK